MAYRTGSPLTVAGAVPDWGRSPTGFPFNRGLPRHLNRGEDSGTTAFKSMKAGVNYLHDKYERRRKDRPFCCQGHGRALSRQRVSGTAANGSAWNGRGGSGGSHLLAAPLAGENGSGLSPPARRLRAPGLHPSGATRGRMVFSPLPPGWRGVGREKNSSRHKLFSPCFRTI